MGGQQQQPQLILNLKLNLSGLTEAQVNSLLQLLEAANQYSEFVLEVVNSDAANGSLDYDETVSALNESKIDEDEATGYDSHKLKQPLPYGLSSLIYKQTQP